MNIKHALAVSLATTSTRIESINSKGLWGIRLSRSCKEFGKQYYDEEEPQSKGFTANSATTYTINLKPVL